MQVNGKTYYHIHLVNKHTHKWKPGKTIQFKTDQINRIFATRFGQLSDDIEQVKSTHYMKDNVVLFKKIEKFLTREATFIDVNEYINDSRRLMVDILLRSREMNQIMSSYHHLLNEMIFEHVRLRRFPALPSRLKCIWLCDKKHVKKWLELFDKRGEKKVYKVNAFGEVHKADRSWLPVDVTPGGEIIDMAFEYWQGNLNPLVKKRQIEYLFSGKLEIVEQLDLSVNSTILKK